MSSPKPRRWWLALLLGLLAIGPEPTSGQQKPAPWIPPTSLDDPRLQVLRLAAPRWEARSGPRREVVDQVCLVPDLPTYFQAIATWDDKHYFPVLIDDVESSFRFIRAFKPARIVRMPKSAAPLPDDKVWERAIESVGHSWSDEANRESYKPRGDSVPKGLGPTPPGIVLSSPDASMLAGAVALAAGHFQPLVRLDFPKKFADVLSLAEVEAFAGTVTDRVKEQFRQYDGIADECDFLTLAGDWPYAYQGADGQHNSVDDKVGRRAAEPPHRWAYAGRLLGDAKESAYRAMCSLFLQPESALMFNGYEETSAPWSDYTMRLAAARLNNILKTAHVAGEIEGSVGGWHDTLDPINRFGLILINSHGSPTGFAIRGAAATTPDIPQSVPTAILIIHSYSAARPLDPDTIAGRWLANGAFLYFGSMNEPYLQTFRNPRLVGDMIAERLPFVVAVRTTLAEPPGLPWRQVFLGDPLYRLKPASEAKAPRLASWEPTASWPAYVEPARPAQGSDLDLFLWSFKAALARLQGKASNATGDDLIETLLSIDRARLPTDFQPMFDALEIDVLLQARRRGELKAKLVQIPKSKRSPIVKRTLENFLAIDFNRAIVRDDAAAARSYWREVMQSEGNQELKEQATKRVGQIASTAVRRQDWLKLLRTTLRDQPKSPVAEQLTAELKRIEHDAKSDR